MLNPEMQNMETSSLYNCARYLCEGYIDGDGKLEVSVLFVLAYEWEDVDSDTCFMITWPSSGTTWWQIYGMGFIDEHL